MRQKKPEKAAKIGGPTNTRVVYVGSEIFRGLSKDAIEISFFGGRQITASQFLQYLFINFGADAKEQLMEEMKKDLVLNKA